MYNEHIQFEFDPVKEERNIKKHGVDFDTAKRVFRDPDLILASDIKHSGVEDRMFAVGRIPDGRVITVWFVEREEKVRIIGAAELRKGRRQYEEEKERKGP